MVTTNGVFSVAIGGVNLATTSSDTIQCKMLANTGDSASIGETAQKLFKFLKPKGILVKKCALR